jgi:hypothetical protein
MIRHVIVESSNHDVAPSVTGVHQTLRSAEDHMASIRHNYRIDGYTIVDNTDTCFTAQKGDDQSTYALHSIRFD